jgi:hypothetical protein
MMIHIKVYDNMNNLKIDIVILNMVWTNFPLDLFLF